MPNVERGRLHPVVVPAGLCRDDLAVDQQVDARLALMRPAADQEADVAPLDRERSAGERADRRVLLADIAARRRGVAVGHLLALAADVALVVGDVLDLDRAVAERRRPRPSSSRRLASRSPRRRSPGASFGSGRRRGSAEHSIAVSLSSRTTRLIQPAGDLRPRLVADRVLDVPEQLEFESAASLRFVTVYCITVAGSDESSTLSGMNGEKASSVTSTGRPSVAIRDATDRIAAIEGHAGKAGRIERAGLAAATDGESRVRTGTVNGAGWT